MTNKPSYSGKEFWNSFAHFLLGLAVISGFFTYTVFSSPIFLYRWAICEIIGPIIRRNSGKAVTLGGATIAAELEEDRSAAKPRYAVVGCLEFEGIVTFEEFRERTLRRWINAEMSNGKGLKYPEFQQYIERWMGYLFWEQDKSFTLENHLSQHKCGERWTELECEQYTCSLVEDLLNKPFPKGKSPWEVHMISKCENSELHSRGKWTTALVFRFHHCLADGFAIFSVICDGFFDIPFAKCNLAHPSSSQISKSDEMCSLKNYLASLWNFTSLPIKVVQEFGYAASLILMPVRTPWYIPDEKRTGLQLYARSRQLSVSKLKFVKDQFGVSFTSVLLSSVGAGIANSFKSKGFPNHIKELPFGSPVPMKGHPRNLTNHWTATLYKIPIDQTLSPLERLKESEKHFQNAKKSTYPYLFLFSTRMTALQLPFLSKAMTRNRSLSAGLTNFPGPGAQVTGFGRDVAGMDFGAGLLDGVAGLGFMVLSYSDNLRLSLVAENAAMERHELEELIEVLCDEIDQLYRLAQSV